MRIWYEVSDLMGWTLPHLTGIQRSVVGIHNGLIDIDCHPRLIRWDAHGSRFVPLAPAGLPETIRHCFKAPPDPAPAVAGAAESGGPHAAAGPVAGTAGARRRRRGSDPEARELAAAFRTFRGAFGKYLRSRLRRGTPLPAVLPGYGGTVTRPQPQPSFAGGHPCAAGDVVLSLGANWWNGHVSALDGLRQDGVRVVRMIYDLIPTLRPQWMIGHETRDITHWIRAALTRSDHVLTISEFSRREIEGYCAEAGLALPDLSVVRLGDVLDDDAGADSGLARPRFVPARPFFLCVCTIDTRKNHRLLVDAWSLLAAADPDRCPDLVCIGFPHVLVADLLRETRGDRAINGRIHLLRNVADAELRWYYRHCLATVYPSRYEGWGLPVAESLAHGKLCLASNAASIPEISPDLPEFFAPHDVAGLVALVRRTLDDPDWVRGREQEIRDRFRPTPWAHTAAQVCAAVGAEAGAVPAAA